MNGKKGQGAILIVIFLFVLALVLGIVFIAVNNFQGELNTMIQEDDTLSNTSKALAQDTTDTLPEILDTVALIFFVGFWIVAIVTAYLSFEHPILAFVSVASLVFMAFAIMAIANFYDDFTSDEEMAESAEEFPFLDYLFNHYIIAFIAVGVSVGIAFAIRAGGGL